VSCASGKHDLLRRRRARGDTHPHRRRRETLDADPQLVGARAHGREPEGAGRVGPDRLIDVAGAAHELDRRVEENGPALILHGARDREHPGRLRIGQRGRGQQAHDGDQRDESSHGQETSHRQETTLL
jgi:hypothetical protein